MNQIFKTKILVSRRPVSPTALILGQNTILQLEKNKTPDYERSSYRQAVTQTDRSLQHEEIRLQVAVRDRKEAEGHYPDT